MITSKVVSNYQIPIDYIMCSLVLLQVLFVWNNMLILGKDNRATNLNMIVVVTVITIKTLHDGHFGGGIWLYDMK